MFAICDGTLSLEEAKRFGAGFIPEQNYIRVPTTSSSDTEDTTICASVKRDEHPDLHAALSQILLRKFILEDEADENSCYEGDSRGCGACCSVM